MMYRISIALLVLLAVLLATLGCSKDRTPARGPGADMPAANRPTDAKLVAIHQLDAKGTLTVTSPAFKHGEPIPATYSAYGEDVSPPLVIANVPVKTQSLVVLVEDPDAKEPKPYIHWVIYNLPASQTSLRTGVPTQIRLTQLGRAEQGPNSRGSTGYFGPKPPVGDPPHHYHFMVFALDTKLNVGPNADRHKVLVAMKGRVLAKGELIGTFQKPKE